MSAIWHDQSLQSWLDAPAARRSTLITSPC
jgi:hypothetical protein